MRDRHEATVYGCSDDLVEWSGVAVATDLADQDNNPSARENGIPGAEYNLATEDRAIFVLIGTETRCFVTLVYGGEGTWTITVGEIVGYRRPQTTSAEAPNDYSECLRFARDHYQVVRVA